MDDDSLGVVGWLILIVVGGFVALVAAVFVIWLVVAFLIYYSAIAGSLLIIGGLLVGVWLPWRTLRGKGTVEPRLLTPGVVVGGQLLGVAPRGEFKSYGWDHAWPNYIPFQANEDGHAVLRDARSWVGGVWTSTRTRFGITTLSPVKQSHPAALVAWLLLVPIPFAGLLIGVWVSVVFGATIMFLLGAVVWGGQQLCMCVLRWGDSLRRRRAGASMKCVHCFSETMTPSYRCSNPECGQVHRSIVPGPLGVVYRRCACGTRLPTTITRASRVMQTVCPFCNQDVVHGSGLRKTLQISVIGAVGAGKSRLIAASTVGLQDRLARDGAELAPLTPEGERVIEQSREVLRTKSQTIKTARADRPCGVPLVVTPVKGRPVELHLLDAAGEYFADWDSTSELHYLDNAPAILFVLDPLALPTVGRQLEVSGGDGEEVVASGNQEEAYASAIDRLRQQRIPTNKRALGVVITKGDVLMSRPCGKDLASASSADLRRWLLDQNEDLFVGRMERDFRVVEYFLVDSMETDNLDSDRHPLVPVAWVSRMSGAPLISLEARGARAVVSPHGHDAKRPVDRSTEVAQA